MNKNLNEAMFELRKADALLASIEALYLDFDILPEEKQKAERGTYAFYCLMDAVNSAIDYLEEYSAECHIVDVIRANRESKNI